MYIYAISPNQKQIRLGVSEITRDPWT
jgi:hypothetical protein